MKVDLNFVIHENLPGGAPLDVGGEDASSETTRRAGEALAAKAQAVDQALVTLAVVTLQIIEQPTPLSHQLE